MLRARDLHKSFIMGRAPLRVLRGASLQAARGEFVVVTGASGSGKSTLLHLLGALDIPDRGTVEYNGQNLFQLGDDARRLYRNRDVGFVFQFYHLLPECTVLENVLMPSLAAHSFWGWRRIRRKARRDAEELLDRVGLTERTKHRPNELSGGERQRVAIARALVNRPALLLADEPTGNLDEEVGEDILRLLTELNEAGQTIVMVTHDAKVASHAHRYVRLSEGVIREAGSPGGKAIPVGLATREVIP
ncbi:MAG: ABC transporter ATP-binding protein [Phycisphaerales bacterium]|nr:MAG: ABC transporter ATP-binding protein [Phycisphaerales bacterium]